MVNSIMDEFNNNPYNNILGGIVFENLQPDSTEIPLNITYKIRLSSTSRNGAPGDLNPSQSGTAGKGWHTNAMFPFFQLVGPRSPNSSHGGPPGNVMFPLFQLVGPV